MNAQLAPVTGEEIDAYSATRALGAALERDL